MWYNTLFDVLRDAFFLTPANVHTHTHTSPIHTHTHPHPHPHHTHTHTIEPFPIQYMSRNYEAHGVEAMKELDILMAQLAVSSPLTHTHTVYHLGGPQGSRMTARRCGHG